MPTKDNVIKSNNTDHSQKVIGHSQQFCLCVEYDQFSMLGSTWLKLLLNTTVMCIVMWEGVGPTQTFFSWFFAWFYVTLNG